VIGQEYGHIPRTMMPLVLLVGFLGSGKTRFLTTLIPALHTHGLRVRVLLNDFENAKIDAARLNELDALVTPLDGECVCCTSLRELMEALQATPADPSTVMLIEANGATAADELLGYLTLDRRLGQYTLPVQLTVIDAGRWQKRWWHNTLEASQATTATHLHLNWTERLRADRLVAVEQSVRQINPRAALTDPTRFAAELAALAERTREQTSRRPMLPVANAEAPASGGTESSAPHARHVHPFASTTLPLPEVVDRSAFLALIAALPPAVVRAKGMVRFRDRPEEMFVWNRIGGRKGVQLDKSAPHAGAQPVALFIGVDLPLAELAQRFEALHP
jgi:G3E family GTPase